MFVFDFDDLLEFLDLGVAVRISPKSTHFQQLKKMDGYKCTFLNETTVRVTKES
jgi:hypothetical protein